MKERNSSSELYRCFCMFGIVALHCAMVTLGTFTWEVNVFKSCVDGFAFISGYYGIRSFKAKKVLNLYFMAVCCIALAELVMAGGHVTSMSLGRMYYCLGKLWFLHAYVILMILAPLINFAAESKEHVKVLLPFCAIILIWGTLSELPVVGKLMIHTNGVSSFSGLTLAAVYAIGRIYRIYELSRRIRFKWVLTAIPVLIFINCFGMTNFRNGEWVSGWFGNYASPFAVLLAVCTFYLFSLMSITGRIGKAIAFVAASMFPVYVIHQHPLFWNWLLAKAAESKANGSGMLSWVAITIMMFVGCVLFDFVRRFVLYICKVTSNWIPVKRGGILP